MPNPDAPFFQPDRHIAGNINRMGMFTLGVNSDIIHLLFSK